MHAYTRGLVLSPADAAVITNATQAAKAVHRVLFEWRAAAKTRLVFFFFPPSRIKLYPSKKVYLGLENPPGGGTCLYAEVCVRACVVIFGRVTSGLPNGGQMFFFLQKFVFPHLWSRRSRCRWCYWDWTRETAMDIIKKSRQEMLFIKITHGYVVQFFFFLIFPIYVPGTLSWYYKLFSWYLSRLIPFWSITWIPASIYVSFLVTLHFKLYISPLIKSVHTIDV